MAFDKLKAVSIDKILLDINLEGEEGTDYPCVCRLGDDKFQPRAFSETVYQWKASALCHKPLYFEEVALEPLWPLMEPDLAAIYFGCPLFCHVPRVALQDGPDAAERVHLQPGLLSAGQLCSVPDRSHSAQPAWSAIEAGAITWGFITIP